MKFLSSNIQLTHVLLVQATLSSVLAGGSTYENSASKPPCPDKKGADVASKAVVPALDQPPKASKYTGSTVQPVKASQRTVSSLKVVQPTEVQKTVAATRPAAVQQVQINSFQSDCFRQHNLRRREARRTDLQWDQNLANMAAQYARELAFNNDGKLKHSEGRGAGENLYAVYGPGDTSCKAAIDAWYYEKPIWENMVRQNPQTKVGDGPFTKYGHYTQVIHKPLKNMIQSTDYKYAAHLERNNKSWLRLC